MQKAICAAAAATCIAASADASSASRDDNAEVQQLRATVAELQMQVQSLMGRQNEAWLTEQRAQEIRGLVQDVLADADTRASLLQGGAVAGYDKNFFLASADGNWMLKIAGQMQFRFVYNNQNDASSDSDRWGFENRRTKLRFFGHAADPSWQYLVLGAFDREGADVGDGGTFALDEGWIAKDFENGWKVRFGQFKAPFLREELVSSTRQMAVERSLVNEEFNQDRVQGVEVEYKADQWRLAGAVSDGFYPSGLGTDGTPWQIEDTEYALTGRIEYIVSGDWKMFDDFSGWREGGTGILLGGAVHYQMDEYGTSGPNPFTTLTTEVEHLGLTADISAKFDRLGLFAAVVYRSLDDDALVDLEQIGFVVQGGYFLTDDVEAFARYEWADADIDGVEDLSAITVGVNKYFNKHNLKWQTDVGFGLDEVESIWSTSSAGWRTDPVGEDGQIALRSQFQLLF